MLKSLKLVNWTSHALTYLEFGRGINLFVGVMGSGKTSALEAISYALFGDFPEGTRKRKLRDVIRHGAQRAEVELIFEFKGKEYWVRRTIKPKSTDAILLINGKLAERGTRRVNEFIERVLGVNYQTFSRIVFSPQNELDNLLLLSPSERKRIMDKLMGIYDMQLVGEKASSLERRLKRIELDISSTIEREDIESKKRKLADLFEREKEIKDKIDKLSKEIDILREEERKINKRYKELESYKQRFDKLKREEAKLVGILSNLSDVEKIDEREVKSLELELEDIKNQINEKKNTIRELEKTIRLYEGKISVEREKAERKKRLLKEFKRLKSQILDLPSVEKLELELEDINAKLANLSAMKKRAEESLNELREAGAKCPVCLSPLSEEKKKNLIEMWLSKKAELQNQINQTIKIIKMFKEKINKLKEEERRQISIKSKIKLVEKELNKIDTIKFEEVLVKKRKLEEKFNKENEELKKFEEKFNRKSLQLFSTKKDFERYLLKIKTEQTLRRIKDELSGMKFSEEEFNRFMILKKEVEVKLHSLKERVNSLKKELELIVSLKNELNDQIKKIDESVSKLKKLKILREDLTIFSDVMNELQYVVRNELLEALNKLLPEIWNSIYPYADYKSIRIEATKDTYKFYAYLNSRWVDLASYASGGERMAFAIAMRIALTSLLVPDLGLLILDEPTHNLDENAINKFISLIEERLPSLIDQTFIITHDERLKSPLASTLYLFKRKKQGNDPTVVEKLNSR